MRKNNRPSPKFSRLKRRLALHCCRMEQKLVDVFCDTPAAITPHFVLILQAHYARWRINGLLQKLYQESRNRWKEARSEERRVGKECL